MKAQPYKKKMRAKKTSGNSRGAVKGGAKFKKVSNRGRSQRYAS